MRLLLLLFLFNYCQAQSILSSMDTIYPVKININDNELVCFKRDQAGKVFYDYQRLVNCLETLSIRDSINASLRVENSKLNQVVDNYRTIKSSLEKEVKLYEGIISEKDLQLKLKERENLVNNLKDQKKNWSLEIFVFLAGGLLGYAIGK